MQNRPLTITLPEETFAAILAGKRREVRHKRNPRIDRYFESKMPVSLKINGRLFRAAGVIGFPTEWRVYISKPM